MDPIDCLESEALLRFFHCHKTEMSCIKKPRTFLSQLKDYDLIPDDRYKKVSRVKSKESMKIALYDILDWFEREQSQHIHVFWRCVFKETMMTLYPILRQLRQSLVDASLHFDTQLPEKVAREETQIRKRKELSEDETEEVKQVNSVKKKRKQKSRSVYDDEEQQPGPSSELTAGRRKKSKKICFSSPLKKGEKSDFWTWPIYKTLLPVKCGHEEGILSRDRLAKGKKCILFQQKWSTPNKFEKFARKRSSKNRKLSIQCMGIPLGKLIMEGHLKSASYRGGPRKEPKLAKRSLFPSDQVITVSDEEEVEDENGDEKDELENQEDQVSSGDQKNSEDITEGFGESEEQTEQQPEADSESSMTVFKVTCGDVAGTLHKKRFGSGTNGKSIRTETSWLSPMEFVKEVSSQRDATWKKDIKWEGKPLNVLIKAEILRIHSLLCTCSLCGPDHEDLENQKNDDECWICKSEEEAELVLCDHCPRSFHQKCHLPHVDKCILGDKRPWMCTFCVLRTNQEWRYSDELEMKAAMSHQISQHMLECHYLLLCLCSADEEQTFASNPSLHLENYSTVIQTPMWFGNVAEKLQKKEYQMVGEFVSDIQLIFTNCASYNQANPEVLATGDRLKELFNGELKKVFNICEQTDK
ncbi:nuclear body protein SP140-like protein isoform X2 [Xiphias gladius]|nr:nuclear body protein SP140-like protein isoform X2 [Xiphias gladius]